MRGSLSIRLSCVRAGLVLGVCLLVSGCAGERRDAGRGESAEESLDLPSQAQLTISRSGSYRPTHADLGDRSGDGPMIVIDADDVVLDLSGLDELRGAPPGAPPDQVTGVAVRVVGRARVTIRGARISGVKCGVHASRCPDLLIEDCVFDDLYRQRLASTPVSEDQGDWLWPHRNDQGQWLATYGAAVCVEDSAGVTLRRNRVRRGQNGIMLDRVSNSKIYDNDCSFLSGWGLAMWRSDGNIISRNALDFCVRGYSHGVYNRGQDSAGILLFEQCSRNVFVQNSATHGGDGVFGFAGRDALGEQWLEQRRAEQRDRTGTERIDERIAVPLDVVAAHVGLGCNDNVFVGNDFSYAAAHGLEMTFSFANVIADNRFASNAICGIWGGYSQRTRIMSNRFEDNGQPGRAEGGGINIEHGSGNVISANLFSRNSVGVALWEDQDAGLRKLPWFVANHRGSQNEQVLGNSFDRDAIGVRVRQVDGAMIVNNTFDGVGNRIDRDGASRVVDAEGLPLLEPAAAPQVECLGSSRPISSRTSLAGRENIIIGEWGPWDHASALLRQSQSRGWFDELEIFGVDGPVEARVLAGDVRVAVHPREPDEPTRTPSRVRIEAVRSGLTQYVVKLGAGESSTGAGSGIDSELRGTLVAASWTVRLWGWVVDPIADYDGWRAEADGPEAVTIETKSIDFPFGYAGPGGAVPSEDAKRAGIGPDRFGLIAQTSIPLPAGKWTIRTTSDDGVRVRVDGKTLINRWDIHSPATDQASFTVDSARDVPIEVEYFQNSGFATLRLLIEPDDETR